MAPSRAVQGRRVAALRLGDERGFSLVELSVVGAVLGLLLSIVVGTFTGAAGKAQERAVQHDLRAGLDAALLFALDAGGPFTIGDRPIGPADLHGAEPALEFAVEGGRDVIGVSLSSDAQTIRLDAIDGGGVRHTLVAVSGDGMRFCRDVAPADCALEEVAPSRHSPGRQDGGTPAADHRQDGRGSVDPQRVDDRPPSRSPRR